MTGTGDKNKKWETGAEKCCTCDVKCGILDAKSRSNWRMRPELLESMVKSVEFSVQYTKHYCTCPGVRGGMISSSALCEREWIRVPVVVRSLFM